MEFLVEQSFETLYSNCLLALARERDQEGDAPHYKGSAIPSRTFRYLQHLTEDETAMMASMQNENHKAQQHHQQQRQQHHQQQHQSAHTSYSNNSVTFENQYSGM